VLNIVIPMAGRGSRFADAGYLVPKPFIDVCGRSMIEHVTENLSPYEPYRFIFLARREHESYIKQHMSFATNVIYVDEITEGAACTVLLAEDRINTDEPLIIANSDQMTVWNDMSKVVWLRNFENIGVRWQESDNIQDMINDAAIRGLDATMATFHATHPKWSYAKVDSCSGYVTAVAEKKVISNRATVGIYWYRHGKDFVEAAHRMMGKNIRVNDEFYVCPVFNEMIELQKRIGVYPIHVMHGLGTPEDLDAFVKKCKKEGWEW